MAELVADYILGRLVEWGVKRVFGYPGDGINAFLGAFDRAQGSPEFIQARHEEMAAFMATGHAKFCGAGGQEIGVCIATSGPGAIHLLNGLYDAKLDHQPVLAIVGQQKRTSLGADYQQEVDLQVLFKDVSCYVQTCSEPAQARQLIDRGIRAALSERGVATVIVPNDVAEEKAVPSPPRAHGSVYTVVGYEPPRVVPKKGAIEEAARVLNAAERVAILIGQGARGASDEIVAAAETLGAGVAKALLGKDVLPDDLPFVTGSIGLLGTRPSYQMMEDCDALFMIGTSFPYAEWLPKEGQAALVEIDLYAERIGDRYAGSENVLLVGDAKATLEELLPLLKRKEDRSWRQGIEKQVNDWWNVLDAQAHMEADPLNPQLVMWELNKQLPEQAIISADSGSSTNWFARYLQMRQGTRASLSGTLATMGPGVPYAVAARFAHPDRPVIAFVGDGAFQMNGMNEMLTVKRYWDSHLKGTQGAPLVFCVFNNQDLNQVTWEQRAMEGDPKYPGSQWLPDFAYARYAELVDFKGVYCDSPDQLEAAWREVLASSEPVVFEVRTDPEIPPLPPHIRVEQAEKMAKALAKGDPERLGIAQKSLVGKLKEFVHSDEPSPHVQHGSGTKDG